MGGHVFSAGSEPLRTPRMPRHVYLHVKEECFRSLQRLYVTVESPIDGPGKSNFGDIDVLLHGPRTVIPGKTEALEQISAALGAFKLMIEGGEAIAGHCALPWPSIFAQDIPEEKESDNAKPYYIQVDVRVCATLQELEWISFKHAHGDIWNIVGSIIRPYGLTVDQDALWLRIPEVETSDRKRAKILLTRDQSQILDFLGLPEAVYYKGPFTTQEELFEYTSHCRLFWVRPENPPSSDSVPDEQAGETGMSGNPTKLKSNDRRRMNYRPIFARWHNEFLAECRRRGRFVTKPTTREELTEEAMERFGVRKEFETRRDDFLRERQRQMIFADIIKPAVPAADPASQVSIMYRSCLVKALKRIILEDDDTYGIRPEKTLKEENGFFITDDVVDFVHKKQEEVGKAAWAINQGKYEKRKTNKRAVKATVGFE